MNKRLKFFSLICAGAILAACGTVAFTGRRQMLLFSDSEIAQLSEQSYNEFMRKASGQTHIGFCRIPV